MKEKEQRNKTLTSKRRQEKKKIREQKIFRKTYVLSKIKLRDYCIHKTMMDIIKIKQWEKIIYMEKFYLN